MRKLEFILNEIESKIEFHEKCIESVSHVSIGWHLEHLMLVINNVVDTMEVSNPEDYQFKYKPIRFVIMTIGKIPRGKARAPKGVRPTEEKCTVESLHFQFEKAKASIQKTQSLGRNKFFAHPYFGNMKLNSAKKFLGIHSSHHLKIINDILHS